MFVVYITPEDTIETIKEINEVKIDNEGNITLLGTAFIRGLPRELKKGKTFKYLTVHEG